MLEWNCYFTSIHGNHTLHLRQCRDAITNKFRLGTHRAGIHRPYIRGGGFVASLSWGQETKIIWQHMTATLGLNHIYSLYGHLLWDVFSLRKTDDWESSGRAQQTDKRKNREISVIITVFASKSVESSFCQRGFTYFCYNILKNV